MLMSITVMHYSTCGPFANGSIGDLLFSGIDKLTGNSAPKDRKRGETRSETHIRAEPVKPTKAEAVEIAIDSVEWAMQIHGAKGYTTEVDLEKRLRDLLGLRIADGATDVLRGQVARGLLGDALYEQSLGRVRENSKAHPLLIEDLLYN